MVLHFSFLLFRITWTINGKDFMRVYCNFLHNIYHYELVTWLVCSFVRKITVNAGTLLTVYQVFLQSRSTSPRDTWMWKRFWLILSLVLLKKASTAPLYKAPSITWQRLFLPGLSPSPSLTYTQTHLRMCLIHKHTKKMPLDLISGFLIYLQSS